MNAEKLVELISKANGAYHLSTVDENGVPHARVFGSKAVIDGEFCFCMGNNKAVYSQITKNSKVALSGHIEGYSWWRANGDAIEVTDEHHKEGMLESMPQLKDLYKGREEEFAVFALRNAVIEEF